MFKNPLKKFQQGGQVSQEQQEMLAAFVEWLPTAVEEFKNMQPEQIVEALNGMAKTPEGQKQVQSLMERFKQELNSPKMRFKEGGKIHQFICKHAKGGHVADCGCNQEGGAIEAQNGGYLQSDTPIHAAALAARKTTRVPWPGVGRRRMGAAMDNNGGKYLYERGDVNGNTAQTSVSIPAPGDTIVRQSVATMDGWDNRTYPEGTDEYESVMKRFRPFIEYGIPAKQDGGEISRRDMFNQANENRGFSRANTRIAYLNAKNGLRNNSDLRGKALRQAARRMVVGEPVTREPIGELKTISVPVAATTTFSTKLAGPTTFGMTQEGLDKMSFNDAFATARQEGNSRFIWKGKAYTTELAEPEQGPALWGNKGFMWNDTRYAVPYGEARLRNTFLRQDGGTLEERYGTINPDSRTGIRRWIDRAIGNSSTLSEIERGINNFKNSAPGKVVQAMLPNPETGMAGAVAPVTKITKISKVRIPTQNIDDLKNFEYNNVVKPGVDFDIDKLYGNSLNFDKFDINAITNKPTIGQRFIGWVKGEMPKTESDWRKVRAGFTSGVIAGGLGMAGLVKAGQSKQNKSNK